MKRLLILFVTLLSLCGAAASVQAADTVYNGTLTGIVGTENSMAVNYQLPGNFQLNGEYDNDVSQASNVLKAGVAYQYSDVFGIKAGVRYDVNQKDPRVYGGLNFLVPFGSVKFAGSYDQNVDGNDWASYEASFRIQMYESLFIYAGVRGNTPGAPVYDYNTAQDPLLFIRADYTYDWPKAEINLQPLLYVQGILLHNYSFKYKFNDRTAMLFNINDLYDRGHVNYKVGLEWKF